MCEVRIVNPSTTKLHPTNSIICRTQFEGTNIKLKISTKANLLDKTPNIYMQKKNLSTKKILIHILYKIRLWTSKNSAEDRVFDVPGVTLSRLNTGVSNLRSTHYDIVGIRFKYYHRVSRVVYYVIIFFSCIVILCVLIHAFDSKSYCLLVTFFFLSEQHKNLSSNPYSITLINAHLFERILHTLNISIVPYYVCIHLFQYLLSKVGVGRGAPRVYFRAVSKRRDDDDGQQLSTRRRRRQFPPRARARHTYSDKNVINYKPPVKAENRGNSGVRSPPCIGIKHINIITYAPSSPVAGRVPSSV
ncbi:hypothetical protein AGLY_013460 [Aphis glycines]|uniref:Uncharacterized protein n=1 Tax=Aphis glycines TaxID=307491 RepID=A0A6G0T7P1_APHGL|nr:hypothetical protein AGLY_013460 [Aphis glycines]